MMNDKRLICQSCDTPTNDQHKNFYITNKRREQQATERDKRGGGDKKIGIKKSLLFET